MSFLIFYKEYEAFLNDLRDLGVIHVEERQSGLPDSEELQELMSRKNRFDVAIKQLTKLMPKKRETSEIAKDLHASELPSVEQGELILKEFDDLTAEKARLSLAKQNLVKEEAQMEPWGNFEPEQVERLRKSGWQLSFFTCPEKNFMRSWLDDYNAIHINQIGSLLYFVTLTKAGISVEIDAERAKMSAYSISELKRQSMETDAALKETDNRLAELAMEKRDTLAVISNRLLSSIEFSEVVLNTEKVAEEKLMLLQGWLPQPKVVKVEEFLQESGVYYEITDPAPEDIDKVPIQFNNNKFFKLFEPICRLYMLPKYNEIDLTPFFAPFFMLFFGLCLGDIGYGLILLGGATVYKMTAKTLAPSLKGMVSLVQILGASTMICGLLSGGFFGFSIYDIDWPFFRQLKETLALDNQQMFNLSLILGGIQIIFGMCLKALNLTIQIGFRYALSTIGWIVLIFSFVFSLALPDAFPMMGKLHLCIMGVAAICIFLLNSPGKNIFLNIGLGLWDTYGMVTGLLGDVLSYVRLFALGLSGGILAGVFNQLAIGMSPDNAVLGPVVMILIFVIGHALNLFMSALGAFVHPLRLTFVEFFKNSGYAGGGKSYKPFKRETI